MLNEINQKSLFQKYYRKDKNDCKWHGKNQ